MSTAGEGIPNDSFEHSVLESLVSSLPQFKDLAPALIRSLASEITWFSLPGGRTLFEADDAADALYVVVSGLLGVFVRPNAVHARLVGYIAAGQTAGEMGLLSGKARSATVIALRDTELVRLSKAAFDSLVLTHTTGLLRIAQVAVERLDASQRREQPKRAIPRTFAVVPFDESVDAMGFATRLVQCLRQFGRAEIVSQSQGANRTSAWFHNVERENDFVAYVSDATRTNWRKLCLRQADLLLLVARVEVGVSAWTTLAASREAEFELRRSELVLLHPGSISRGAARDWIALRPSINHHNICGPQDVERLTRILTGRAIGLTLSGGGARGFAHIGVIRALQEARLPIDAVGGTSIGAIIGAGCAAGWDYRELRDRLRHAFMDSNPLNDYTLPLVSLVAGRKVGRMLRQTFGDLDLEDLRLPYFCVSANLTRGVGEVHRRGELWRWLRASIAIPGILPPVFSDGQVYVDGATINNLPVDVMRDFMRGCVVGVDVSADRAFSTDMDEAELPSIWRMLPWFRRKQRRVNILQILLRASMVNSSINAAVQRDLSDLLLRPPLENVDLLDWRAFDRTVDAGYRHTCEVLKVHGARLAAATSWRA
jgi:NTE family protein